MKEAMVRIIGADVRVKSADVMKKRRLNEIFQAPLKEVLYDLPEIGEFLRERGVGCEGCQLFHLADLGEVFRCYKLSREEFYEILQSIGVEV